MKDSFRKLYAIAELQGGFFTAKQATEAGFSPPHHSYHVKSGNWEREMRGIYRLAHYPLPERPDFIRWSLWSRGKDDKPQGVFSHETALAYYDLSDINPSKWHMTVPKSFRKSTPIPRGIVLHFGQLEPEDYQERESFRVTKPMKTILDLCESQSVEDYIIIQAISEGQSRGLLTIKELEKHAERLIKFVPESKCLLRAS